MMLFNSDHDPGTDNIFNNRKDFENIAKIEVFSVSKLRLTFQYSEENTYTKIMIMVGARGVEENGVDNGSYIAVHE